MLDKYVSTKKAKSVLGVHVLTLHNWEKAGKIETIRTAGGHRLYNVEKYLKENNKNEKVKKILKDDNGILQRKKICYVRVSTIGQKDDLARQKKYMEKKYPKHEIIEDIGSGINFNRRGIKKIIKMAINGEIEELVVAHKDRLTRFGYELIENLIKEYSDGEIIIDDKDNKIKEPKNELVEDVLEILNVYTAKLNGMRNI
jgi:predicted site-specific integrase-resolvase